MANIEEKVETLVTPIINNLGYEVYDVIYEKCGKENYLRIFIDKESGIDLNDCETVNNAVNDILDECDYIKDAYFLEISSPGIERNLRKEKHFEKYIGCQIELSLYRPVKGKEKKIIGILQSVDKENIVINTDENLTVERKNIASAKTVYDWDK